jgi:hypothetical protein
MTRRLVRLTRCPIHGRRFQHYCVALDSCDVTIRQLSGSLCCEHFRHRKWRFAFLHGERAEMGNSPMAGQARAAAPG